GMDVVQDLADFPVAALGHDVPWEELVAPPEESALAERGLRERQIVPALRGGWPRRPERGAALDRAVAIDAVDLDRIAGLAVELAVAVHVLLEMTVGAVHALLEVDILEMNGLLETIGVVMADDRSLGVEQIALAILLVDPAEDPAPAVEVGELGPRELRVEVGHVGEERRIRPQPAQSRRLRIRLQDFGGLTRGEMLLLLGIHHLAVRLMVPPGIAEIGVGQRRSRVVVTDDALAAGDGGGERVLDGVSGFIFRNGRVDRIAASEMPVLGERS